jgi:hypothetical protein
VTKWNTVPEFSRFIHLADLGRKDLKLTLSATSSEREALASRLEITEISALESKLRVYRIEDGVFEVRGSLEAEIVFIAEHAADAMDFTVNEALHEVFATEAGWASLLEASSDGDVNAEPLTGDSLDLGEVVAQNLSLALDPLLLELGSLETDAVTYTAGGSGGDEAPAHPFAGLAALRRPENQNDDSSDA